MPLRTVPVMLTMKATKSMVGKDSFIIFTNSDSRRLRGRIIKTRNTLMSPKIINTH